MLGAAVGSVPTVAAKSHFGNLGAGSGLVECVTSILAHAARELFPLLNHQTPDPDCPIRPARGGEPAGDIFVSAAVTPQGQAGAVSLAGERLSSVVSRAHRQCGCRRLTALSPRTVPFRLRA